MSTSTDRPSPYQMGILKAAGSRVRPRTYESARRRIDGLPPSQAQAALLTRLGLPVPETRSAASQALTAYEQAHPDWARARLAERAARGRATLARHRKEGQEPRYDDALLRYRQAGVERFGTGAASAGALSLLRALALRLPRDSDERIAEFEAMRKGLSAREAGTRIDRLRPRVSG